MSDEVGKAPKAVRSGVSVVPLSRLTPALENHCEQVVVRDDPLGFGLADLIADPAATVAASGAAGMIAREAIRQIGETRRERLRQEGETMRALIHRGASDGVGAPLRREDDPSEDEANE